jgi:hypothetical protein
MFAGRSPGTASRRHGRRLFSPSVGISFYQWSSSWPFVFLTP